MDNLSTMLSRCTLTLLVVSCCFLSIVSPLTVHAQCPSLGQNATFTSTDCVAGFTPCTLCPGDQFTLTATGTGLHPGDCINWYYGTTNNFNPYTGGGDLLGCSLIAPIPPNSCNPCPIFVGILVDACGVEENNEYMMMWSGGGFYVSDLSVDFDDIDNAGAGNEDIGSGCSFQTPSATLMANIENNCPNSTIIGVGAGK